MARQLARRSVLCLWILLAAAPAFASEVPSGATPEELEELKLAIRLAPVGDLQRLLTISPIVPRLNTDQKNALLDAFAPSRESRVLATTINFSLPGVGSLVQGDVGYGLPILGTSLLGAGLALRSATGGPQNTAAAGMVLFGVAWFAGLIRPLFYEDVRVEILKNSFLQLELGPNGIVGRF
jgi:hypothetical protein